MIAEKTKTTNKQKKKCPGRFEIRWVAKVRKQLVRVAGGQGDKGEHLKHTVHLKDVCSFWV